MSRFNISSILSAVLCIPLLLSCQALTIEQNSKTQLELWPNISSPVKDETSVNTQIEAILAQMSLEEKVGQIIQAELRSVTTSDIKEYHLGSILNGGGSTPYKIARAPVAAWQKLAEEYYQASMDTSDGRVAIPVIWGTDAVHGHGNVHGATLFPHNIGLGATRNTDLIRAIGSATAKEVKATAIDWVFAPTIAVGRNDRWGRTYESYAEDPTIIADFSAAMIEGMQGKVNTANFLDKQHVIATLKHFIADGGTKGGDDQGDTQISEQELINIHGAGYFTGLRAGAQTVMASFSSWNGDRMHGNHYLLTEVLKGRLGFDGVVVGDWNGQRHLEGCTLESCAAAINAGIDLVMVPDDWKAMYQNTLAQVKKGDITLERLNDAVRRMLRIKVRAGLFKAKPTFNKQLVGHKSHRALARQAVRESLVLLKNNHSILPLQPAQNILVAGDGANHIGRQSGGWSVTWQGTETSNDDFPGATSIYTGIQEAVNSAGGNAILSVDGSYLNKPDVAIVVFGEEPYAEGNGDIATLEFEAGTKDSLKLLQKFTAANIPVISIFLSGRPLWVNPELNASQAFVAAWLPGSEGAGIADVIIANKQGKVRHPFTGKLSFSWPKTPLQSELHSSQINYNPLFPFGFGLSYETASLLPTLNEQEAGIADAITINSALFVAGKLKSPWRVYLSDTDSSKKLNGQFVHINGSTSIESTDKELQGDALTLTWSNPHASITLQDSSIDLSEQGLLAFEIKLDAFKGTLEATMSSDDHNTKHYPLTQHATQWLNQGWQQVTLPVTCLGFNKNDLNNITRPFGLKTTGKGKLSVSNIRVLSEGTATIDCGD